MDKLHVLNVLNLLSRQSIYGHTSPLFTFSSSKLLFIYCVFEKKANMRNRLLITRFNIVFTFILTHSITKLHCNSLWSILIKKAIVFS